MASSHPPVVKGRRQCVEAFLFADQEGKGFLSQEDYKVAVVGLFGYKPSKYEVDSVWSGAALTHKQGLSQESFIQLMLSWLSSQDWGQKIRDTFLAFDKHCQGFIRLVECKEAFQLVAPHISEDMVLRLFREVDGDMDGRVSYRDFELMVHHVTVLIGKE